MPSAQPSRTAVLAVAALLMAAGTASAQNAQPGQAAGLRYLSWTGRAAPAAQPAAAPAAPARADLRRPNRVIPHGGFASAVPAERPGLTPAPNSAPGRLTPAEAWIPRRTVAPVPSAAPVPEPAPETAPEPAPPPPAPVEATPYAAPAFVPMEPPRELLPPGYPDYAASRGARQPIPADVITPPVEASTPVYGDGTPAGAMPEDPMAPRRDAPIFRLQRPAPAPVQTAPEAPAPRAEPAAARPDAPRTAVVTANTADRPTRDQGARYYSVHRQAGRTPDALSIPEPTYIDALAVTLAETPASQDLAQPDRGPTLIRDNQGRLRAAPAASDGDHQ